MMIGAQELTKSPAAQREHSGAPRLEIERLAALDDAGQPAVHERHRSPCSAGEIVGIAGVSGNGQRELVEVLAGQREASGGEIRVAGERLPRDARGDAPPQALAACRRSRCATPASRG